MQDHNLEKVYYEYLAKLILEHYLPEKYSNLILSDRPDLRMGDNHGIEVTRAMYPQIAQAEGIFKHIANKNIGDIDPRYISTLKEYNSKPMIANSGMVVGICPGPAMLINDSVLRIIYQKKIEKVEKYKRATSINDLFIFSPQYNWLEENNVNTFFAWIEKGKKCSFESIMVFEYSYLYSFCFASKKMAKVPVGKESRESLYNCRIMAYEYAIKKIGEIHDQL